MTELIITMNDDKNGIKERITLIAKKPKMFAMTFVAVLLVVFIAVGCTFTGARNNAEIVSLTEEEVEKYNKILEPFVSDEDGNLTINPLSHFLRSYYDKPENLNLAEFLRYYPSDEDVTNETEFEALKAHKNWPFGADATLDNMPVPIHKFYYASVNEVLGKYMGISLEDLSGIGMNEIIYLKEYNAYYNFTSDAGFGSFVGTSGETQGDIIRLYSKSAVLVLKKQKDGFLFVSHQPIEEGAGNNDDNNIDNDNNNDNADSVNIDIKVEAEGDIPDPVLDYAREYVELQIEFYSEIGKYPPLSDMEYTITDAKITGLTVMNTGTAGLNHGISMYLLEYRLRPDKPENVVLAGGMRMEEIDGESWITEWGSTGQPYLLLAWDNIGMETLWQSICVTNTDIITQDYGTPEMLERYGNEFTAAAMELYKKNVTLIRTIGQVSTAYTLEEELGHTAIREVAELLMTELLNELKIEQDDRSFTITEWKNLKVNADRMYDAWLVTGEVDVRYEGILSPIGYSDDVPEGKYVTVSLGDRYLKHENGMYILSLSAGKQEAILTPPLLTPDMNIGIGVIPDYISDDILIFHGYFGLFVYDLKSEEITFAADLEKAVGTTAIQGSEGAAVRVSADGNTIQLYFYPEQGEPLMAYTINSRTGKYDYGYYAPLEEYSDTASLMYDRFSNQWTLGELTYTDGKNSYLLFKNWDWAD